MLLGQGFSELLTVSNLSPVALVVMAVRFVTETGSLEVWFGNFYFALTNLQV